MAKNNARKRTRKHFKEQNGKCWICGLPMEQVKEGITNLRTAPLEATLDHIRPKDPSKSETRPTKAAHRFCNMMRGHKDGISPSAMGCVKKLVEEANLL